MLQNKNISIEQSPSSLKGLSDSQLQLRTRELAKAEQRLTLQVLLHLKEISDRKLHAKLGYASLWEYTVKELGYCEASASSRIAAMRLMASVPEARTQIENGKLTLSQAARIHQFIRKENQASSEPITKSETKAIIQASLGSSIRETQRMLEAKAQERRPSLIEEKPNQPVVSFQADEETLQMLERLRELRGNLGALELFKLSLKTTLDKIDPLRKMQKVIGNSKPDPSLFAQKLKDDCLAVDRNLCPTSPKPSRFIPQWIRIEVAKRSKGQCEYHSPLSGKRCESRYRVQYDHIVPIARGGIGTLENIQHLCGLHNRTKGVQLESAYFEAGLVPISSERGSPRSST